MPDTVEEQVSGGRALLGHSLFQELIAPFYFHSATVPGSTNRFRPVKGLSILLCLILLTACPVWATDPPPDLSDAIGSLQVVSGMADVPNVRDVTGDGLVDMKDAIYSILYVATMYWMGPAGELTVAETLEEEVLQPRDIDVTGISEDLEDALAQTLIEANEAELQSVILFNAFYMADDGVTSREELLNRYRALMKSYEITTEKYDAIMAVHAQIEDDDIREPQSSPRAAPSMAASGLNLDPKLQWYIDNYGKTTPGGNKIDVKTIAERNKISTQRAFTVLKTHYGVIAEKENATAIQYEAAEKTAVEIKAAADTANTALSFVAGGQAALGVYKAVQTAQTAGRMYRAGTLGFETMQYIMKTQGKNVVRGAVNGAFSMGDGVMGVLTDPSVSSAFSTNTQENLDTAKKIWSAVSVAKGLFDGSCLLSVRDASTGQARLIVSDLTNFTKTTVDTTGLVISLLQNNDGSFTQAVQRPESTFGEAVKSAMVYQRVRPETMLPNGSYKTKDENDVTTSFTVTSSTAATLLPNLPVDDRLIGNDGAVAAIAEPPYEHYCGWEVDFEGLTVYDEGDLLFYYKSSTGIDDGYWEKHGPYYAWWSDSSRSQLVVAQCYFEDTSHGLYTSWHQNGVKAAQYNYNMGKQEGLETSWYSNGQKSEEGTWGTGEAQYQYREGLWTIWYDTGNKKEEAYWVNGELHGPYKSWYEDGARRQEGQYTNWEQSGIWIIYNEDDTCKHRIDYDSGGYALECE